VRVYGKSAIEQDNPDAPLRIPTPHEGKHIPMRTGNVGEKGGVTLTLTIDLDTITKILY